MPPYIAREASKLWRRITIETTVEWPLLMEKWKFILLGIVCQYLHGLAARGVHYLHRPGPTLQDVGFFVLPELGQDKAYISETVFSVVFFTFFLWTFHPFIFHSKKFYTVHLWCRVLAFLVCAFLLLKGDANYDLPFVGLPLAHALNFLSSSIESTCYLYLLHSSYYYLFAFTILPYSSYHQQQWQIEPHPLPLEYSLEHASKHFSLKVSQFLRIITFMSTQLPGPNYHCREGSRLARLPRPDGILEVLLINFPRGVIYGCGDLIFSSHMIFTLVFVLTYQKYGTKRWIKQIAWLVAVIQSLLIIASRKHYTVDVVVAWYTVNLVVYFVDRQLSEEGTERSGPGGSVPLLPLNGRDKDSRTKEEHHKLMNGNSGDSPDWRQRSQVNGKILEDGSPIITEIVMNGT